MSTTVLQQRVVELDALDVNGSSSVQQRSSTRNQQVQDTLSAEFPGHYQQDSSDAAIGSIPSADEFDTNAGWIVVGAGAVQFFVYLGLTYSYGIIQLHLVSAKLSNVATISFIGSTAACIGPLMGMLVVRLMSKIGYRWTSMLGSILLGLGEFTAGFATKSVPGMFLTQGILFGMGSSLLFFPAVTLPSLWFKRKRGIATGIVYGGAGLGSAVLAITLEKLIETNGIDTALKVMGILAWVLCIPASWFLKAPPGRDRPIARIQRRLFRSIKFWCLLVMSAVAIFPLFVPPFLLPLYITSVGFSTQTGAAILAAWNLASALGRVGMGFGADSFLGPVNSMLSCLVVIGVTAMALWPYATSLGLLIFFSILNGACSGGFFSLVPVVVGAVLGDTQLASTMSTITTSWTFGYFMGVPLASYLLEAYGGADHGLEAFRPVFFYAGSITLGSAGMLLAVKLMTNGNLLAKV